MTELPRVIDEIGDGLILEFRGVYFGIDRITRRVYWACPWGEHLQAIEDMVRVMLGPETYNALETRYTGDWEAAAYEPRNAAELEIGDLITLESHLHTVTGLTRVAHRIEILTDSAEFAGPYPVDADRRIPVHPDTTAAPSPAEHLALSGLRPVDTPPTDLTARRAAPATLSTPGPFNGTHRPMTLKTC
ncbi:hypothetical protein ACFYZ8_33370 [Streptomyces sp. NPDC001668]|uniref:hypothetical protein n=1 Tax=Streptomyces sp. NPDC001668 TaxID=3364598 RepID=UPI0036D0FED3